MATEQAPGIRAWLVEYTNGTESVHLKRDDAERAATRQKVRGRLVPMVPARRKDDKAATP